MVYLGLNIVATIFLILFTRYFDKRIRSDSYESNSFIICLLLVTIESIGYSLVLILNNAGWSAIVPQIMKILLVLEGFFFINLSFGILGMSIDPKMSALQIIKYLLLAFSIYIVYFHYSSIEVSVESGIMVVSEYLFNGPARTFFPWTWVTVFQAVIKTFLPAFAWLTLLVLQENKEATQLQKYQGLLIGESLVVMWGISMLITFVSQASPGFSLLFVYSYIFMFILLFGAITKTTVPSGKGIAVSIIKIVITYFLPAIIIGGVCTFLQPKGELTPAFTVMLVAISVVMILVSLRISEMLSSNTKFYTADYETKLEKDLASVDYSGEMDVITSRMYDIVRHNIETTSMSVYIDNAHGSLEVAYSSNGMTAPIPFNNPIFDTLLNENKSVVVYSELEKAHSVASIKNELEQFFKETKSDALFLLNEGHNLVGIITLGNKIGGDHFKEYDYNVFVKLYSYFFVFGYYMRNISNKEIISVVKREIKMSSQIITSIQENIDHIKDPKVDIGYLMIPARNIGGEFIDLIRLTESRHLFVVGDLSGKGIAASMNMVILKSIIRTYLAETHDFKQLIVKVNQFIRESLQKGTIFAGLFALIDFETDTMYYINCGIPALMLYTQVYNNVIEIQGSGHILGFVKDISPYISVKTTKLNKGDIILACTDGLIQSHSLRGEQFGRDRVQQALLDNSTYPAQRMAQFTFDTLLKFMSKEMEDDVSILCIKYENQNDKKEETETTSENTPEAVEVPVEEAGENPVTEESAETTEITETAEEQVFTEEPALNVEIPVADETVVAEPTVEPEVTETPVDEPVVEEAAVPAEEEKTEDAPAGDMGIPADADLPEGFDLGDIDAMMKMAGL